MSETYDCYNKSLKELTGKLDSILGEFDYLQSQIKQEIEILTELDGEVCERAENIACALDLNRRTFKKKEVLKGLTDGK